MQEFKYHPSAETVAEITGIDNVEALARGGFKYVFKVSPVESDPYVLKFVRAETTFTEGSEPVTFSEPIQRCLREIALMERCPSKYLPKLGPIEQGYKEVGDSKFLYFSEEMVGERTLRAFMNGKTLDGVTVRKLIRNVASALTAYAPEKIVHRDIKPDNILLRDDSSDFVLIDSGIYYSPTESSLTPSGFYVGTPDYVSPEQMRRSLTLDVRSDIYALGVVAYEALTGTNPHRMFPTAKGILRDQELQHAILYTKPPMIEVDAEKGIDSRLVKVVDMMLEKQAYKRPRTAQALVDMLDSEEESA